MPHPTSPAALLALTGPAPAPSPGAAIPALWPGAPARPGPRRRRRPPVRPHDHHRHASAPPSSTTTAALPRSA
jgi:hypothetical protein